MPADPNKLFEVSLTTFIKINFLDSKTEERRYNPGFQNSKTYVLIHNKLIQVSIPVRSKTTNSTESLFIIKEHLHPIGNKMEEIQIKAVENGNGVDNDSVKRWKHESDSIREELKYAVVMEKDTNGAQIFAEATLVLLMSLSFAYFM